MQLQFNSSILPCVHTLKREIQSQELTQEMRLSEGTPGIGRVIGAWGQPVIRGKEWRTGNAGVSGGVMVWVLYIPEDEGEPQCVETWIPFQMKWDLPSTQRDGTIRVNPYLRGVDARSLSARKLMIRVGLGMVGEMLLPADVEICEPVDVPEDVQMRKQIYPVQLPRESGEKDFLLEEQFTLPLGKVLRYSLRPQLLESRVVTDKLVIRGLALLTLLYMDREGKLQKCDMEFPFSQYAELEREYDGEAEASICLCVTALELERTEEEQLCLKAGITAQYVISDRTMVGVVEDLYSPYRQVVVEKSTAQLPVVLENALHVISVSCPLDLRSTDVIDGVIYPDQPSVAREGDHLQAELAGSVQVLYYDQDDQLNGFAGRWEEIWHTDVAENAVAVLGVQPKGQLQQALNGTGVTLHGELQLEMQTMDSHGIPMAIAAEIGEKNEPEPGRPSLLLMRAGEKSLWEIAKATGSTEEAIRKANGIETEPDWNQMLLIPVL